MGADESRIRVLLVEDHRLLAEALGLMLESKAGIEVVGSAATGEEGVRLAAETRPAVALLDYRLPDATGAEVARRIRAAVPDAAVVILTGDPSDEALAAAVEAGAVGFLTKSGSAATVVDAVRRAAAGEILLGPDALAALVRRARERIPLSAERERAAASLTAREREILALMAQGLDTRAIAERLVVGVSTVRTHAQSVLEKLGAHSRLEAVARASSLGILTSGGRAQ